MNLLDFLDKNYLQKGFYLVPVKEKAKEPIYKNTDEIASNSRDQLALWIKKHPKCNWAIYPKKSGLIAVDVDLDEPEKNYFGTTLWNKLISENEEPDTWKQQTGTDTFHYVFKADESAKYKGYLGTEKGIQTRFSNYILVEPSIHPETGKMYKVLSDKTPIEVPAWLNELIVKKKKELTAASSRMLLSLQYLEKISDQLRDKEIPLDRDTWLRLGMSLHSMSDSQEYLDFWIKISEENVNANPAGEYESCSYRWGGFKYDEDDLITGHTFTYICERLGCSIPNPELDQDRLAFASYGYQKMIIEAEIYPEWFEEDGKQVCRHKDFIVDFINGLGYASVRNNPDGAIICLRNEDGFPIYSQLDQKQTKIDFRFYFYKFYKSTSKGYEAKYKSAYDVWFEHCKSTQFTEICFDHKERPGSLNMFVPIPCSPMPGDVSFLDVLFDDVLCNGNKAKGQHLRKWLAHIVQKPAEYCSIVPVVIGEEGTGKGLVFINIMGAILKRYHYKIDSPKGITDRFNQPLAFRLLTVLDEAAWSGNHEESDKLKSITGNKTLDIEEKFGKKVLVNNYSRYALLSNRENAAAISASNRRYWVFNTNENYAQRTDFFDPIFRFLETENAANMLYNYFMNIDISDFNPHVLPKFDSLGQEAKEITEGPIAQYWLARFNDEPKGIFTADGYLPTNVAYTDFKDFIKENGLRVYQMTSQSFWRKTVKLAPSLARAEKVKRNILNGGVKSSRFEYKIDPEDFKISLSSKMGINLPDFSYFDMFEENDFDSV
jgi:hypothetical protein